MTTFATRADLLTRVNARVLLQLAVPTDQDIPPEEAFRLAMQGETLTGYTEAEVDAVTLALQAVDTALADATELMVKHGVLITSTGTLLARLCSTIAVYYLRGESNMTDESRRAYESADKTLKSHQRGEINLNPAPVAPATADVGIEITSNQRRYINGAGADWDEW